MMPVILSLSVAGVSVAILLVLIIMLVRRDIEERHKRKEQKNDYTPFEDSMSTHGGAGD